MVKVVSWRKISKLHCSNNFDRPIWGFTNFLSKTHCFCVIVFVSMSESRQQNFGKNKNPGSTSWIKTWMVILLQENLGFHPWYWLNWLWETCVSLVKFKMASQSIYFFQALPDCNQLLEGMFVQNHCFWAEYVICF